VDAERGLQSAVYSLQSVVCSLPQGAILGLSKKEIDAQFDEIVDFASEYVFAGDDSLSRNKPSTSGWGNYIFTVLMNPVTTKDDIAVRLAPCKEKIRQLGGLSISLFGSFVRNEANSDSDGDLLVQFAPGAKTFDHFMTLAFLLEDALGRTVELVTTESLSPYIGKHILEEAENVPFAA